MGTAAEQGALWGARAQDWRDCAEPVWENVFEAVLDAGGVGPGTEYLDIGCGTGGALARARARGAEVSGLDASAAFVALARERLPGADIRAGEMEELPFGDGAFDVVSGINAFQFAGDVRHALAEAARVCRPGGLVAALRWGPPEANDLLGSVMPAVFALLPPGPGAPRPPDPATWPSMLEDAGLSAVGETGLAADLVFPSLDVATRASLSASARAIRHAGEAKVREALDAAFARFEQADGSVRLASAFRISTARRPR